MLPRILNLARAGCEHDGAGYGSNVGALFRAGVFGAAGAGCVWATSTGGYHC
jgi:hypothetical protein